MPHVEGILVFALVECDDDLRQVWRLWQGWLVMGAIGVRILVES